MESKKIPALDNALENIRNYIIVNDLQEGDRLPSEREMCEMWGVSRSALRSAIRQLSTMHVLQSRRGSGTYVAPRRPVSVSGGETLGFSDNVRNAGHRPSSKVVSQEECSGDEHVARKMGIDLGQSTLRLMRVRYVDDLPCMLETTYINEALSPGIGSHDFSRESLFGVLKSSYGLKLRHGRDELSITRLEGWEADLLGGLEGDAAFFQEGVCKDLDGHCIEYFKSVIRPDRYTFLNISGKPVDFTSPRW